MTATPGLVAARVVERERTARREYWYARAVWLDVRRHSFDADRRSRAFREAVDARTAWSNYFDLLREPSWTERRAEGIDATELALMATGS